MHKPYPLPKSKPRPVRELTEEEEVMRQVVRYLLEYSKTKEKVHEKGST
jgi:hypothetical protein